MARDDRLQQQITGIMRGLVAGGTYWMPNFGLLIFRSGLNQLTLLMGVEQHSVLGRCIVVQEACRLLGVEFLILDLAVFPSRSDDGSSWTMEWIPAPVIGDEAIRYERPSLEDLDVPCPTISSLAPAPMASTSMEVV